MISWRKLSHDSFPVQLEADHPGFSDFEYVARRNYIAQRCKEYVGTIESIPIIQYTKRETHTWRQIFSQLEKLSKKYAFAHHLQGMQSLGLSKGTIPSLRKLSEQLNTTTGFRMVPVPGLVKPRIFLEALAEGVFMSTQYIRHHRKPGFTPEPDIIHEIIGHGPQLVNSIIAQITREIGMAAKRANEKELEELSRLYWFTIEYGVCLEDGEKKAYGAGNLSSFIDISRCVSDKAMHKPFDVNEIIHTPYNPTIHQPLLFVVDSFEEALLQIQKFTSRI